MSELEHLRPRFDAVVAEITELRDAALAHDHGEHPNPEPGVFTATARREGADVRVAWNAGPVTTDKYRVKRGDGYAITIRGALDYHDIEAPTSATEYTVLAKDADGVNLAESVASVPAVDVEVPHESLADEFDRLDGRLRGLKQGCEHHFHDDHHLPHRFDAAIAELGSIRAACGEGSQEPQPSDPVPDAAGIDSAFIVAIAELDALAHHCIGHHHEVIDLPERFGDLRDELDALRLVCAHPPGEEEPEHPPHDHDSFLERVPEGWIYLRTDAHWRDLGGGHPIRRHLHLEQAYPPPDEPQSGIVEIPTRITPFFQVGMLDRAKYQTQETDGKVIQFDQPMVNGQPVDFVMPVDTTKEPDMLGLLRNYFFITHPEGNEQSCRPRVPMLFRNGNAKKSPSGGTDMWGVTTWYKVFPDLDFGYLHAGLSVATYKPFEEKGDTWEIQPEFVLNDKGTGPPLTRWFVALDVNYHAGTPDPDSDPVEADPYGGGVLLKEGRGQFKDKLTLDLSGVSPGEHDLVLCAIQEAGEREARAYGFFRFTKA